MGAMPLYLVIILARANAYLHASATLCLSGTVYILGKELKEKSSAGLEAQLCFER